MDSAVPLEKQRRCNLSDFMISDPQRSTILFRSGHRSQRNHRTQPERNGVSRHLFLMHTCRDEHSFNTGTILFHPGQLLAKGSNRAEQKFRLVAANKIVQGWDHELFKPRVSNRRILGLSYEVRKKGDGTRTPTAYVTNTKGKAAQLTKPLRSRKSK